MLNTDPLVYIVFPFPNITLYVQHKTRKPHFPIPSPPVTSAKKVCKNILLHQPTTYPPSMHASITKVEVNKTYV
ncbi:hypothetical protein EYC80_002618 [Monilinia laxa]|uniref:Uncharacterized protein n=1 Tax=Monilinia laxa TaxID=61186 RepID=A0A5N6K4J5_MONLA|nr:hypothetical protein EYC80_002618 [Monilinia laxa]